MLMHPRTKQWKTKITAWRLEKNLKKREVNRVIRQRRQRRKIGKASEFRIRGLLVDETRIDRNLKRAHKTEDDVPSRMTSPALSTCSAIICYTPRPSPTPGTTNVSNQVLEDGESVLWPNNKIHLPRSMADVRRSISRSQQGSAMIQQNLVGRHLCNSRPEAMRLAGIVNASAIPIFIAPPRIYKISEGIFKPIRCYFNGIFASRSWSSVRQSSMRPPSWHHPFTAASDLLCLGQAEEAKQALDQTSVKLKQAIESQSPEFIPDLLDALNRNVTPHGAINATRELLTQVYWIARWLLGVNHPFVTISYNLFHLDDWVPVSEVAHMVVYDAFESAFGPANEDVISRRIDLIGCYLRGRDLATAESLSRKCVQDLESRAMQNSQLLPYSFYYLAVTLIERGNFAEAEDLTRRIARWNEDWGGLKPVLNAFLQEWTFWMKCSAQEEQSFLNFAERKLSEACNLANTRLGPGDPLVFRSTIRIKDLMKYHIQNHSVKRSEWHASRPRPSPDGRLC